MRCEEFRALLNRWMDGELNEPDFVQALSHAEGCSECMNEFRAAKQLKALMPNINNGITVPLSAQSAWRSAVRSQRALAKRRKTIRWLGAAAAVIVAAVGISLFQANQGAHLNARVETDGANVQTSMVESTPDQPVTTATEWVLRVENVDEVERYIRDIAQEYGGEVAFTQREDGNVKLAIACRSDAAYGFVSAVQGLGHADSDIELPPQEGMVEIDVLLKGE